MSITIFHFLFSFNFRWWRLTGAGHHFLPVTVRLLAAVPFSLLPSWLPRGGQTRAPRAQVKTSTTWIPVHRRFVAGVSIRTPTSRAEPLSRARLLAGQSTHVGANPPRRSIPAPSSLSDWLPHRRAHNPHPRTNSAELSTAGAFRRLDWRYPHRVGADMPSPCHGLGLGCPCPSHGSGRLHAMPAA